jgi:hypothetical protein
MQHFREVLTQAWKSAGGRTFVNVYDGEMNGLIIAVNTIYNGQRSGHGCASRALCAVKPCLRFAAAAYGY